MNDKAFITKLVIILCTSIIISSLIISGTINKNTKEFRDLGIDINSGYVDITSVEQYTEILMQDNGLSYAQAEQKAQEVFRNRNSGGVLRRYSRTKRYAYYSVDYGFHAFVTEGSYPVFLSIVSGSPFSSASGSGDYEWVQDGIISAAITGNGSRVMLVGQGKITVTVNSSTSMSGNYHVSIPELISVGFSQTAQIGATRYYRKTVILDDNFKMWYA